MMCLFEGAKDTGKITKKALKNWVVRISKLMIKASRFSCTCDLGLDGVNIEMLTSYNATGSRARNAKD